MRFAALAVISLGVMALDAAHAADASWQIDGLDHVMLWTDNIDRTTVHPLELEKLAAFLRGHGFELDPPSPLSYDPDGAGPLPAVPASGGASH